MRRRLTIATILLLTACQPQQDRPAHAVVSPLPVTAQQFRSFAWLQGQWRGTLNDTAPFYEGYRFLDDSTLLSITFTDSSAAVIQDSSQIRLRAGVVSSGDSSSGYVLAALDSISAHFEPRGRATNSFTWRRRPDGTWTATLNWRDASGRAMQREYVMRPLRSP